MKSYKDLDIYKMAYELAIKVHTMSFTLTKYELIEQYDILGKKINNLFSMLKTIGISITSSQKQATK